MQITQPIATIFAALIAAFLGSWAGAQLSLARFKQERAFDRRLDWYERMIRALYNAASDLAVAKTFEWDVRDGTGSAETAIEIWRRFQTIHLDVNKLTVEGSLYAHQESFRKLWEATDVLQDLADHTNAFSELAGEALPQVNPTIRALRSAADELASDIRSQLGLDPLGVHPRDLDRQKHP